MTDRAAETPRPREEKRPWCLPCRELDGDRHHANVNGVVCEWHWGILTDEDQAALTAAIREYHAKGGRVTRVLEQIWVVRKSLRETPNTVVATWKAEAEFGQTHDDWRTEVRA